MYLLEEAHVACVGGASFGAPECIRMSYATSAVSYTHLDVYKRQHQCFIIFIIKLMISGWVLLIYTFYKGTFLFVHGLSLIHIL